MTQHISSLARIVAKETGQSVKQTERTLWAAFDALARTLAEGGRFSVPNFGTFEARDHAATKVRLITTGEIQTVAARRRVHFHPTGRLTAMVRTGQPASIRKKGSRREQSS